MAAPPPPPGHSALWTHVATGIGVLAGLSSLVVNFTGEGTHVPVFVLSALAVLVGGVLLARRRAEPLDRQAVVAIALIVVGAAVATTAAYGYRSDAGAVVAERGPEPSPTPAPHGTAAGEAGEVGLADSISPVGPVESPGAVVPTAEFPETQSPEPAATAPRGNGFRGTLRLPAGSGIDVDTNRIVTPFRPGDDANVDLYSPGVPYLYGASSELFVAPYGSAATALDRCRSAVEAPIFSAAQLAASPSQELCLITSEQKVAWLSPVTVTADDLTVNLRVDDR